MRTIKFRGKDCNTNEWVYGDLLHLCGGSLIYHGSQTESEGATDKEENGRKLAITFYIEEVAVCYPQTIGQFTGLCDIYGKEIYEGDILADVNGFIRKVAFVEDAASPMLIWLNDEDIDSPMPIFCSFIRKYGYRAIGNVFDNPELLSKSK